jgi:hypothetical protein
MKSILNIHQLYGHINSDSFYIFKDRDGMKTGFDAQDLKSKKKKKMQINSG